MNVINKYSFSKLGFSLIETMTAVAVTGIVLLAASQVATYVNHQVQKTVSLNQQMQIENVVAEHMNYSDSCTKAIGYEAPNGGVVLSGTNWQNSTGYPVQLYIPGVDSGTSMTGNTISEVPGNGDNILPALGVKIYSLRIADAYNVSASGLNPQTPAGTSQYIAKLIMQVGPLNGSGPMGPEEVVNILTLDVKNGSNQVYLCRGGVTQSQAEVCQAFDCTYNSNGSCTCPQYAHGCSNGYEIPISIDANGQFNCIMPQGTCGTNQYLSGIGSQILCTNYPQSQSCLVTPQWGSGCSAPQSAIFYGTTATFVSTATGTTGQATYNCSSTGTISGPTNPSCTGAPTQCSPTTSPTWSANGNSCSGPLSATPVGQTAVATSSSPSGSATFACNANGTWATTPNSSPAPTCGASICPSGFAWDFQGTQINQTTLPSGSCGSTNYGATSGNWLCGCKGTCNSNCSDWGAHGGFCLVTATVTSTHQPYFYLPNLSSECECYRNQCP